MTAATTAVRDSILSHIERWPAWSPAAVANKHGLVRIHGRLHTQGC
jgi:hypothetical protein